MLKVACVYAPIAHKTFEENLKVVDEDFGRLPPLSLAYAAAIAERAGHDVIIVDANAERLSQEEAIERLRPFAPDVLCFTVSTYMYRETTAWIAALRAALGAKTVVGGVNVRLYPEETVRHPAIDYAVSGFALVGLPALLDALEHGRSPVGLPEVIAVADDGRVVQGEQRKGVNPFKELPRPARHLLKNELYYSIISQRRNFTVMMTSVGCPWDCSYCAIAPLPYHHATVDAVIAEIVECVERYGVREIDFFDADFFANRKWAHEFCERIASLGLDLEWSCRARVDEMTRDTLTLAKAAGCRQVYVGIETPSEDALRVMKKEIQADGVREHLNLMHEIGIRPLGFFMLGVPGETHASALRTIHYTLSLPLEYAQFSRMIAKPASQLHRDLVAQTGQDYWRDYVLGNEVPPRLPNIWSHLSDAAVERYTKLAYALFYYRPGYVLKALGRMRSADELVRSARTALRMLRGFAHRDGDNDPC